MKLERIIKLTMPVDKDKTEAILLNANTFRSLKTPYYGGTCITLDERSINSKFYKVIHVLESLDEVHALIKQAREESNGR